MKIDNETMKQISIFIPEIRDNYYITKEGEVYNINTGRETVGNKVGHGYLKVNLPIKTNDGKYKRKSYLKHRLVMLCFNPIENADKYQVNHKNEIKTDNRFENLEWCTNLENNKHAIENELIKLNGEDNPSSKFTDEERLEIINDLLKKEQSQRALAKKWGCSQSLLSMILNKKIWLYLTKDIDFN